MEGEITAVLAKTVDPGIVPDVRPVSAMLTQLDIVNVRCGTRFECDEHEELIATFKARNRAG
jgi:hypothetical protein